MAETVTMPKLGFDMAEGVLVRWVKKVGDPINKGDVIAEIETDKATVEVECPFSGVVLKHLVEQSTSVPVGDPIAVVGAAGEQVSDQAAAPKSQTLPAGWPTKPSEPEAVRAAPEPVVAAPVSGPVFASPLARKVARDHQVDLSRVQGSGPNGRVVRRDVEAAIVSGAPLSAPAGTGSVQSTPVAIQRDDERIPLNKLRSAIGRRMVESKTTIPHFQVTHQIRADQLMETRAQFNALVADEEKLSVNDFIVKAAALALRAYPNLNASLTPTELIRHGHVNIGVAVSVEGGLLTIVVKDADHKSMREISAEVKEMAARTRQGKVKPDDIEGSTFSISNLGMYAVEAFTAIINPPEAAILAVGSVHDAPVVEDGQIKVGKLLNATISADHRVTDGAEAAQFMQELARLLENPLLMVM